MVKNFAISLKTFTVVSVLLLCVACAGTAPSKFYTLDSLQMQQGIQEYTSRTSGCILVVGPVTIPDYMERPQIVTRSSGQEIYIDEFNRWAGSLSEDIMRVLTENLSVLLSQAHISASQWTLGSTAKYQVPIDVRRFDVMPDGNVLLKANWSIYDQGKKQTLTTSETLVKETIVGQDYNAKVSAMSKALEALSRDIADAIKAR